MYSRVKKLIEIVNQSTCYIVVGVNITVKVRWVVTASILGLYCYIIIDAPSSLATPCRDNVYMDTTIISLATNVTVDLMRYRNVVVWKLEQVVLSSYQKY